MHPPAQGGIALVLQAALERGGHAVEHAAHAGGRDDPRAGG
jgi:hypothetical protein